MTMKQQTDNWITLKEFNSEQEAAIVKGRLEDAGIPCMIESTTMQSVYPLTMTWAPIKLLVPESQATAAREILG